MLSFAKHDSAEPAASTAYGKQGQRSHFHKDPRSSALHLQAPPVHHRIQAFTDAPFLQAKLTVNTPGDVYERQADEMANEVMRSPGTKLEHTCTCGGRCADCQKKEILQARAGVPGLGATSTDTRLVDRELQNPGQSLDSATKNFMETRFGHDFGRVRIHADRHAADSAGSISARAYTSGEHIVFGQGEYSPTSDGGRWLLAHELTHIVQQGAGHSSASLTKGMVQRAPTITVVPENFIGPLAMTQRRAARSCPIYCCSNNLGTLNAMPLFYHQSRSGIVAAGSAAATGVGAELHFTANAAQPPAGDLCHCDDFRMIQILTTNSPAAGRGNSYVDNNQSPTPFYGDVYRSGRGEHEIPGGYVDAGEKVSSTESIYDRPYRTPTGTTSVNWMAETCVACIKHPGPDRILGGVTYGFTQNYNAAAGRFDPVAGVGPDCVDAPSANFISTLSSDPSTSNYNFKASPGMLECNPPGDYPLPTGDTRIA